MPNPPTTAGHLSRYSNRTAVTAAALVMLLLTVRLLAVPVALAALLADRLAVRLDRCLAGLPLAPQPARTTATRHHPAPFSSLTST